MVRKNVSTKNSEGTPKGGHGVLVGAGIVLGLVFTTGVVVWARSDTGQIDVSATIQNSQNSGVRDENAPAPVPAISNELAEMKNGGLVPQGEDSVPPPEPTPTPVPSTTTATTSSEEGTGTPVEVNESENLETTTEASQTSEAL